MEAVLNEKCTLEIHICAQLRCCLPTIVIIEEAFCARKLRNQQYIVDARCLPEGFPSSSEGGDCHQQLERGAWQITAVTLLPKRRVRTKSKARAYRSAALQPQHFCPVCCFGRRAVHSKQSVALFEKGRLSLSGEVNAPSGTGDASFKDALVN